MGDLIVCLISAINTPYGFIFGKDILRRRLGRAEGLSNYIKFFSIPYVGLKILRIRDFVSGSTLSGAQTAFFTFLLMCSIYSMTHYCARLLEYQLRTRWSEGFFCKDWNESELRHGLNLKTLEKLMGRSTRGMSVSAVTGADFLQDCWTQRLNDSRRCKMLGHMTRNVHLTMQFAKRCNDSNAYLSVLDGHKEINVTEHQSVFRHYCRLYFELINIALSYGGVMLARYREDISAALPTALLTLTTLFIKAYLEAVFVFFYTTKHGKVIEFYRRIKTIDHVLQRRGAPESHRKNLAAFYIANFDHMNRTTQPTEAPLLYSVPIGLRTTKSKRDLFRAKIPFMRGCKEVVDTIMDSAQEYCYAPGNVITYLGDVLPRVYLIARGFVIQIDALGNIKCRGPGFLFGGSSFWMVGVQNQTTYALTYVSLFIVTKENYMRGLDQNTFRKAQFLYHYTSTMPHLMAVLAQLDRIAQPYKYTQQVCNNIMAQERLFTNKPPNWTRLTETRKWSSDCFQ